MDDLANDATCIALFHEDASHRSHDAHIVIDNLVDGGQILFAELRAALHTPNAATPDYAVDSSATSDVPSWSSSNSVTLAKTFAHFTFLGSNQLD